MRDAATYIKLLSSQRAASGFMRYFTLYGARGGHTNPAPLPFRVAKAKPCMQTAGIQTPPEARKATRHRRAKKERGNTAAVAVPRAPSNGKLFQLTRRPGSKSTRHLLAPIGARRWDITQYNMIITALWHKSGVVSFSVALFFKLHCGKKKA